ncbi:MAG: hypothetical protein BRD38_04050 [Bacteroidetes bacterium QH_9_67_14]|nr:MAG: hypothetical protein BRD38_04050 [Bacteroidetes bacterium QH_9_67_14]
MVDAGREPGYDTPGPQTPGSVVPGSVEPDASPVGAEEVSATGVAVDATGTTAVGTPEGRGGEIEEVRVNASAADFDFNVNADGNGIFSAVQSPSGTDEEVFRPDAELAEFDGDAPDIVFEVTSASATGGATADVTVVTAIEEQTA